MTEKEETPQTTTAPVVEASPAISFPDTKSFNERLERETKKRLKELGIDDPVATKAKLDQLATMEKQAEEAKRAQLSETERLRTDLSAKEAAATQAMSRAEQAELKSHLYKVFAETGVKNFDYAFYAVTNKLSAMGDDEELDERAFLAELAKDPSQAVALGIAGAAPPPSVTNVPVNTVPGTQQPRAPQANAPSPPKDAFSLSPQEWQAKKAALGV